MRGVFFDQRVAPVARSPYRADVALFVGFVDRRRRKHVPGMPIDDVVAQRIVPSDDDPGDPRLYRWLVTEGWARGVPDADRARIDELVGIPVPIDSFATFDRLFAWEFRPCGTDYCDTYLGAAIRSFFVQGGRLCYVVRVDTPPAVPLDGPAAAAFIAQQETQLAKLVPGYPSAVVQSPADERTDWSGVWLVFGLPDVSMIALPDLPDLVRGPLPADRGLPPPRPVDVAFEECSDPAADGDDTQFVRDLLAPTSDDAGFVAWNRVVFLLADQIARVRTGGLREVQLVAAVPRPSDSHVDADLVRFLSEEPFSLDATLETRGLSSAFVQLVYPWLSTAASSKLPETLEPPDGTLCGAIARNALERGTYRSLGGRPLIDVTSVIPKLSGRDLADPSDLTTLAGRVTVLGRDPRGFSVLSDVTTSLDPTFRLAHANRLMSALVRGLRTIGEDMTFEPSNERTWSALRARATDLLRVFWRAGALDGGKESDAFTVRCDASTTSQNDLDDGRVVVEVTVSLTVSIQRINVVVTRNGGEATLERAA
jgi:uncharacterized protein